MATARRTARELGKSDPIDALAVARAALREPGLPVAQLDGEARRLRLLVDHREDIVGERTRMQSRLRWHVHELFPGLEIAPKSLGRQHRIALTQWRGVGPGRAYVQHRLGAGSTKTEALRLLRRRLSDEVFRRLVSDETLTGSTPVGEEVIAA